MQAWTWGNVFFPLLFLPCYSNLCPLCVWQEVMYFPESFLFCFLWINFKSNFKTTMLCPSFFGLSWWWCLLPKYTHAHWKQTCCNRCWPTDHSGTHQLHVWGDFDKCFVCGNCAYCFQTKLPFPLSYTMQCTKKSLDYIDCSFIHDTVKSSYLTGML